ncbi:acetate uptake transporter [Vagococcus intermedius]|uniref:Acetate uptake transporter n=1 Tax=Vagococcus intermedius TaxID=2991418 RepID=A0AAF0CTM8_9ENTE|nr:acetate uptake transporter [Vagococcus intermedius]WEG72641.1 acetate uptake transporter [Vagococcus intermedius]WEG74727.1 acetate uptake transporter [Vagococcus intermedius]
MSQQEITVKHKLIDPSAIGLFGLAMVTLVASSQKLEWTEGVGGVIPWAIFLGGILQIVAAVYDAKENNVFGATAFFGYGFFWLGTATAWLVQNGVFGKALQATYDPKQLGFAFIGYLIFTIFMTIGAMETHKVLFIIFVLIDFLFIGLALSTLGVAVDFFHMLAAISELLISLFSFYGSAAAVLNKHFGRTFLPVGKPFGIFK